MIGRAVQGRNDWGVQGRNDRAAALKRVALHDWAAVRAREREREREGGRERETETERERDWMGVYMAGPRFGCCAG